jgi:hypothetical protein
VYIHRASLYWQCTIASQQPFIPLKIQNLFEVWLWCQNSQVSFSPYELLNTLPLNATMQQNTKSFIWKPKPCRPLDSNILNVILNHKCQVHLEPFKKIDFDAWIYYKFFSSSFPHSWSCSSHFAQPKDTLSRFLAPTITIVLQHRFKVLQQKFPLPKCILIFICHSILPLKPFISSSSFKHQSLIAILTSNYYYFAKSLAQRNFSMTSPVIRTRKKYQKRTCSLVLPFSLLSYLPPSITQTFLQCNCSLHHPLFGTTLVLHNAQINLTFISNNY